MLFWSNVMEQIIGALKNEKLSGTLLAALLLIVWYAYGWASDEHENYVKQSDFTELKTLMIDYIADSAIVNASQLVRDKELALQVAEATNESPVQLAHIRDEIEDAEKYKNCLIAKDPNCKHIKPPE